MILTWYLIKSDEWLDSNSYAGRKLWIWILFQLTIQQLLNGNEFSGALDLITTSKDILCQDLRGVVSFRHLSSQLEEIQSVIGTYSSWYPIALKSCVSIYLFSFIGPTFSLDIVLKMSLNNKHKKQMQFEFSIRWKLICDKTQIMLV